MSENTGVALEFVDVSCQRADVALNRVTLSIPAGAGYLLQGDRSAELLLRVVSLLEPPDRGEVWVAEQNIQGLDEAARTVLRSRLFGFVFSAPYLLPELSVAENIAMPLFKLLNVDASEAQDRTEAALRFAGLESLATSLAGSLCWFDQQRVALARAIVHQPAVCVLDQADLNLSEGEWGPFMDLARRARRELGLALLVRSFHPVSPRPDERILRAADGEVREETIVAAEPPDSLS